MNGERSLKLDDKVLLQKMEAGIAELLKTARIEVPVPGGTEAALKPASSGQYPGYWPRDGEWVLQSNIIPIPLIRSMVKVLAATQNGPEDLFLENGLIVPKWAIADHVREDNGEPIYFPGTYSYGMNQGDGRYGYCAAQDGSYLMPEYAWYLRETDGFEDYLRAEVYGVPLIDRMMNAFHSPDIDPEGTQLAYTTHERRAIAYTDAIYKTGCMLEGSVLRWRCATRISVLLNRLGRSKEAREYADIADTIKSNIIPVFWDETKPGEEGWLFSATGVGRQHCVRGTVFAIAYGILDSPYKEMASRALARATPDPACRDFPPTGAVSYIGHVRHLKNGEYWERSAAGMPKEKYQNGGYWIMFSPWYLHALALTDMELAVRCRDELLKFMFEWYFLGNDSDEKGAPWEWIHPDGRRIGPRYLAGLTLLYRGLTSDFLVNSTD
jgi:hypothetical protein